MRVRILAGLAAGATLLCAQNQEAGQGRALFRSNCAFCHGLNGLGGRGPNLVSGDQRSDDETKSIIRNGVPGSTMPEFSSFTEEQLKRIVVFLHQLRGTTAPEEPVKGDPTAGRAVYEQNGCTTCHQIEGSGGVFGPGLSRIGAARSVAYLRESIVAPSADVPAEWDTVVVTTNRGGKVSGIRVNEDTFTVQIRTVDGKFASFAKDGVREVAYPKDSQMPAYTALAPSDLDNLIAFLKSLRGGTAEGSVKAAGGVR